MINFSSRKHLIFLFVCTTIAIVPRLMLAQKCGCAEDLCCSRWGFCGTGNAYCGKGCQGGPCNNYTTTSPNNYSNNHHHNINNANDTNSTSINTTTTNNTTNTNTNTTNTTTAANNNDNNNMGISDDNVVSESFFNGIANQAASSCDGKGFYTRDAFLEALKSYPRFANVGSFNDTNREIAAFFAHVTHETGHMCYISEINGPSKNYCDEENIEYPCVPGKKYYGRGPIQLSWNFNYGPAGKDIGFDGLNDPDIVARDNITAFKTALWYWMNNCHSLITSGQGFGATIRAIYGAFECDGGNPSAVARRIDYYTQYCHQLGVDTGNRTSC